MTADLIQKVSKFCRKHALLEQADRLVVGVSGGPDSLGLLHILKQLAAPFNLTLTVAHLNHRLRADAQADENFVREVSAAWQLPFYTEACDVALLAGQRQQSLEETARQVRYAFFGRVAAQVNAAKVAVGHNANDQAETVLMHFLRGSGLSGLRGMRPAAPLPRSPAAGVATPPPPTLIRPLLNVTRAEIEDYCQAQRLRPRRDRSNEDLSFFRNRLRHQLIPYLETYNPNLSQVLVRTAQVVAAEEALLAEQVDRAWAVVVKEIEAYKIIFDLEQWLRLPLALKRSTLRRAVQTLGDDGRDLAFEHIEAAVELINSQKVGGQAVFPHGLGITVSYTTFVMAKQPFISVKTFDFPCLATGLTLPVNLPGVTALPGTNWQLRASLLEVNELPQPHPRPAGRWEAYLDADRIKLPVLLRTRRPGDTFCPLGLQGHHQNLAEFMVDQKIPGEWRACLPLVEGGNQILWVSGYRLDERSRLQSGTTRVLVLKFEKFV